MSGPYAAGIGLMKRRYSHETSNDDEESDHSAIFFSSNEDTPPKPKKLRRVTYADAEVIPKFRPEDNTNNVTNWLHKIDPLGDVYGWGTTDRQFVMQLRLRGSAKDWYDDLDNYNLNWEEWKHALENAFPQTTDYVDKLETMLARTKKDSETMTKYYHDKLSLLKKCNIHGEEAISCIIRGLPGELRVNAKAYQCQTPEPLYYGYLSSLENYRRVETTTTMRKSIWKKSGTELNSTPISQQMGVKRCYFCRRTGHEARECRARQRCDVCQRAGHTSTSCWFAATPGPSGRPNQTLQLTEGGESRRVEGSRESRQLQDGRVLKHD